jgi:hypothetical protein
MSGAYASTRTGASAGEEAEGAGLSATWRNPPGARPDGSGLERSIQVIKVRGSSHVTQRRKLLIQQGGLAVEPFAPAAP